MDKLIKDGIPKTKISHLHNFIDTDTYEMAQRLLNCGSTKSLEDIYKFIWNLKREGDEDE